MSFCAKAVFIATLFAGGLVAADPDFSGVWTLDEARSLRRMPDQPWKRMKVDHLNTEVKCVPVESPAFETKKGNRMLMHFATNGKETAHPLGEASGKSIAKWEGSALMINTIVNSPHRSYTQMDRWKLSRDGNTLTIRRQVVTLHGEVESTLVYGKQ
jgi:hypothetical protein